MVSVVSEVVGDVDFRGCFVYQDVFEVPEGTFVCTFGRSVCRPPPKLFFQSDVYLRLDRVEGGERE